MERMHDVVKHFSSKIRNRKNYNGMLDTHLYLPRNQLQKDHNYARIVTACEFLKSVLRIKKGHKCTTIIIKYRYF